MSVSQYTHSLFFRDNSEDELFSRSVEELSFRVLGWFSYHVARSDYDYPYHYYYLDLLNDNFDVVLSPVEIRIDLVNLTSRVSFQEV